MSKLYPRINLTSEENIMYSIGLDIGIASCGWCVINSENGRIVDLGVSLFSSKNSAK